jgi:hypothetical protein
MITSLEIKLKKRAAASRRKRAEDARTCSCRAEEAIHFAVVDDAYRILDVILVQNRRSPIDTVCQSSTIGRQRRNL